jgi:hypothetical protein
MRTAGTARFLLLPVLAPAADLGGFVGFAIDHGPSEVGGPMT